MARAAGNFSGACAPVGLDVNISQDSSGSVVTFKSLHLDDTVLCLQLEIAVQGIYFF